MGKKLLSKVKQNVITSYSVNYVLCLQIDAKQSCITGLMGILFVSQTTNSSSFTYVTFSHSKKEEEEVCIV